jgi:hypothetical protein
MSDLADRITSGARQAFGSITTTGGTLGMESSFLAPILGGIVAIEGGEGHNVWLTTILRPILPHLGSKSGNQEYHRNNHKYQGNDGKFKEIFHH